MVWCNSWSTFHNHHSYINQIDMSYTPKSTVFHVTEDRKHQGALFYASFGLFFRTNNYIHLNEGRNFKTSKRNSLDFSRINVWFCHFHPTWNHLFMFDYDSTKKNLNLRTTVKMHPGPLILYLFRTPVEDPTS